MGAAQRDGGGVVKATIVTVLEPFTFCDGVRLAWVTWRIGEGERQCVSVRELAPNIPSGSLDERNERTLRRCGP